jgi:hypothetical protein
MASSLIAFILLISVCCLNLDTFKDKFLIVTEPAFD